MRCTPRSYGQPGSLNGMNMIAGVHDSSHRRKPVIVRTRRSQAPQSRSSAEGDQKTSGHQSAGYCADLGPCINPSSPSPMRKRHPSKEPGAPVRFRTCSPSAGRRAGNVFRMLSKHVEFAGREQAYVFFMRSQKSVCRTNCDVTSKFCVPALHRNGWVYSVDAYGPNGWPR